MKYAKGPTAAFMNFTLYAVLPAFVVMSAVTRSSEVTLAGEFWGTAYGFPLLWQVRDATSLSRMFAYKPFLIDLLFHIAIVSTIYIPFRSKIYMASKRIQVLMSTAILMAATAAAFGLLLNFLDPNVVPWLDGIKSVPGSNTLHIGFSFK